jgi:2-isopropylmalate synthase
VNTLDAVTRKAVLVFYPPLASVQLVDYKVRVLIESSDGEQEWCTMGSSVNIIEAIWLTLADSL